MTNMLESYFDAAMQRIHDLPAYIEGLPKLDYPECEYPYHSEFTDPRDEVLTVKDFMKKYEKVRSKSLTNEERSLLDGSIRAVGLDVYAFYKSRRQISHSPHPGKWGIFYLEPGATRIKELIELTYPGYGLSLRLAYEFLRQHEYFHFKFDFYTLHLEAAMGRSLYQLLNMIFRRHEIYRIEEALANQDAWDWAKQKTIGIEEFAYDFMKLQPGAYARFDEKRSDLASELAANLLDLNFSTTARRDDQAQWVAMIPEEFLRKSLCPEYVIRPVMLPKWILPAWKLPTVKSVRESSSFMQLMSTKFVSIKDHWEKTKAKLIQNPGLPGLQFKRWKSTEYWSVRVNDNFRAHLRQLSPAEGIWEADEFGSHTAMGHG